ncbi:HeH/LEM domain-containing protein [Jeotgalicoccus halotolerans]|nr:HeH/LEM domain-containing protein [Jeotgalicoccus halotolerans]
MQNLNDYTVAELKTMLDEQGIEYSSSARKADLIGLLEE